MAKMHTKTHGKSKSRKPVLGKPGEARLNESEVKEVEKAIEEYAKQGMSPAMIGEKLKRDHKVPYIKEMAGRRLGMILKEKGLLGAIPEDLMDLMKRAVVLHKHLDRNKHDIYGKTRLQRVESKIFRLSSYYIRENVLPGNWKYNPKEAELLIKSKA
jgi:ribosomal protein S15P/S13E